MTRPPTRSSEFLRFYLRSGYPLMVLGVIVVGLLRGLTMIQIVWFASACLILSMVLAHFGLRRQRRIDSYDAPAHMSTAGLPASAVIPSDRRARHRGLAVAWWGLVVVSTAAVGWGLVEMVSNSADEFNLRDLVVLVLAVLWIVGVATFFWTRPALTRGALLAERKPDARVMTVLVGVMNGIACGSALSTACGVTGNWWRARLPMHTTLVVDHRGIEFWRGWIRPRQQYSVPWPHIGGVSPAFVDVGDTNAADMGLGVSVGLRVGTEGWLDIEFRPTRSTFWMTYPYRKSSVVEAFIEAIDELRPARDELFRGVSLKEWKEIVDSAEAEGDQESVDEVLADLREWRDSRSGPLPAGGDWLSGRFADQAD